MPKKRTAVPSRSEIRKRAKAAQHYPKSVPDDTSKGWHPTRKSLVAFAQSELRSADAVREAMRTGGVDLNAWAHMMWMWARRTRRDILVIEEYLKGQQAAGHLKGAIPFYNDPGDPPPPPDSFF